MLTRSGFVKASSKNTSATSEGDFVLRLVAPPGHVIMTSLVYVPATRVIEGAAPGEACLSHYPSFFSSNPATSTIRKEKGATCIAEAPDPHVFTAERLYLQMDPTSLASW